MKTTNILTALLILLTFLLIQSCRTGSNNENKEIQGDSVKAGDSNHESLPDTIVELSEDQMKQAGIEFGSITEKPLGTKIKASGIVSAPPGNMASVSTTMGGFVKNATLLPGSQVHKGQVLATIENPEFIDLQQNYLETSSKLEFAEADFKRHSQLHSDDVYSTQNLQQVTADYKSLKAQSNALAQKLRLIGIDPDKLNENNITGSIQVYSPINGYIRAINASNGKYAAPSDVLFEVVNNDRMYLELTLFERDMNKISTGQKVEFFLNNETESHQAIVYQVAKAIAADKSFKVYANVDVPCKNVIPGMYVSASILSTGTKVSTVPSEAVVRFDDKDYIFIHYRDKKEDGKPVTEFRMVEVEKGITSGNSTGILLPAGFDPSSRIVIKGAFQLMAAKKNAGEMSC
jgi:membrane fusion protein, heavy metal efflux system